MRRHIVEVSQAPIGWRWDGPFDRIDRVEIGQTVGARLPANASVGTIEMRQIRWPFRVQARSYSSSVFHFLCVHYEDDVAV
jgi:hypothetical protein